MKSSHPTGLHFFRRNPNPKKERHGDCGVRAISLALDLPYNKVWNAATQATRRNTPDWRYSGGWNSEWIKSKATANSGLTRTDMIDTFSILRIFNWDYVKAPVGTKFVAGNFPDHCIANLASHYVAVKDGAIWDTWDSRGKRAKMLKGFFYQTAR